MASFNWDDNFITGLDSVDDQHLHLVQLINDFSDKITRNACSQHSKEHLLRELAEYAVYHFKEEESLMAQKGVDRQYLRHHVNVHQDFLREVNIMMAGIDKSDPQSTRQLLDFLTHWLAYHILGEDQEMARQIAAIDQGVPPGDASKDAQAQKNSSTEPLLVALNGLFELVSQRNKTLLQLNESLEQQVEHRTRALKEANRHLEELSLTDALTGLPNRRHAMNSLARIWQEKGPCGEELVCIMIDADHFKEVNDQYGHEAGDRVLVELARMLRHSFRNDDIVCRLGGDEFFAICPATTLDGGKHVAQQVLERVGRMRVATGEGYWTGSISVGVAARSTKMAHHEALIRLADKSVYAAKKAGKNCVRSQPVN